MSIVVDSSVVLAWCLADEGVVLETARSHGLSVYDSACLEVAQRRQVPLATLDGRLREAGERPGIVLFQEGR